MKVEVIKAYKSEDGCIYENEAEATNENIDLCIQNMNHHCEGSNSNIYNDVKKWFRDRPKDVRYILANINKIKDHIAE